MFISEDLFEIIPSSIYTNFSKMKEQLKANHNDKVDTYFFEQMIQYEVESTHKRGDELIGKPIYYNEEFQLIHDQTQQYLWVSDDYIVKGTELEEKLELSWKIAENEENFRAYNLVLSDSTGPTSHFIFTPSFDHQAPGYILKDDLIYLTYVDRNTWLFPKSRTVSCKKCLSMFDFLRGWSRFSFTSFLFEFSHSTLNGAWRGLDPQNE